MPRVRSMKLLFAVAMLAALALGVRFAAIGSGVGAGFAAHVVCSLVFVSGQPAEQVFDEYVWHEIWPLGSAIGLEIGEDEVVANVFGTPRARAVYRPGRGCTQMFGNAPPQALATLPAPPARATPDLPWPAGDTGPSSPPAPAIAAALERAFAEPENARAGGRVTTAIAIAHDGALVAERYAPGVDAATPLISWSMAKSVLATLYAVAEAQQRVVREAPVAVTAWRGSGDTRRSITLDQMLRMSSGLSFDERYGATNEASVMLFARGDTALYASERRLDAPPDSVWNYSSGTTNILSRVLGRAVARGADLRTWARQHLFARIGAHSALVEADSSGTLIFSSFAFMTARDWARLGELHRNDGVWLGERILPAGWVTYVTTPTPASNGEYGAHWWLNRGTFEDPQTPTWPELPPDTYAARGHNGQYVMVVPSEKLVVVRLGLSTDADHGVEELVAELIAHYRGREG